MPKNLVCWMYFFVFLQLTSGADIYLDGVFSELISSVLSSGAYIKKQVSESGRGV